MSAILGLIYCYLKDMLNFANDLGKGAWESVWQVPGLLLSGISVEVLSTPIIPDQYAWILGATGMSQAIAIIASALLVRFALQAIPFVRWGS